MLEDSRRTVREFASDLVVVLAQPVPPCFQRVAIRVMTMTQRAVLTRAGPAAQRAYLLAFLRLVHQHECVRMYTVAFALFPNRTQSAALAAAQRVVTNAKQQRYIQSVNWMDSHRYYALTKRGAAFLNELDPELEAHSTMHALHLENKRHRHWGVLIAIASAQRGMEGFSEALISGEMHNDITTYFGHTPDAVTIANNIAVWHEVETSRRSTTRRAETQGTLCGAEKLTHLVRTIREKRVLEHRGWAYPLILVMHCAGEAIERSVRAILDAAVKTLGGEKTSTGYSVPCDGADSDPLTITINLLPLEPEDGAWCGLLPWAGCPVKPVSECDEYLRPATVATRVDQDKSLGDAGQD